MPDDLTATRIAILGAGLIGASWTALFLHHGMAVTVWDPVDEAREALGGRITGPLEQLARLHPDAPSRGSLVTTGSLREAVVESGFIQESVPESIPVKHDLYAQIEALAPEHAIVASSTSALTWSDISVGMGSAHRLITAHPFNPPHLVPLVELYGTEADVLARAEALYRAIGMVPVRLKRDATGHIANRLASALWREAVNIVAEGIADVEAVDAALVNGPGLRWSVLGAHMAYHLGGGAGGIEGYLAHLGPSQERRWATLGNPRLTPDVCAALVDGIRREAAGRDIATLESQRDEALIQALLARREAGNV